MQLIFSIPYVLVRFYHYWLFNLQYLFVFDSLIPLFLYYRFYWIFSYNST